MIPFTLTMPRLGETMEEGIITAWLVEVGQPFRRGDALLELESDKTSVEFPALGDGVLEATLVGAGDRVTVGHPIAEAKVAAISDWVDEATAPAAPPAASEVSILRMPRLGETMEEGVIVQWLVPEGGAYKRGEAILEIETDKTVAEVPALADEILLKILAQPKDRVAVTMPIAEVQGEVEPFSEAEVAPEPTASLAEIAPAPLPLSASRSEGGKLRATPLARRLAREAGVDLESLTGTGRRGRIEGADVEAAMGGLPLESGLQSLITAEGSLRYEVKGTNGATVLLLHGFAGDHTAWAMTSAALARAGRRVVTPDLPGHGATEIEARTFADLVTATTRLAEGLQGPLTVVGHSLGAAVAVAVAGRLGPKVESLLLFTPAGCGARIGAEFVHGMAEAKSTGEVAHLLRLLGPKGAALSENLLGQMAATMAKGRLIPLAQEIATRDGRQKIDILRPLADLSVPVTAIFGTEDRVVDPTDALNLPANVAARFLPTGHMPQWDMTKEIVQLILNGGR